MKTILLVFCVVGWYPLTAQTSPADRLPYAKAVYVEALGASGFGFSLNYDMRFKRGRNEGWGFRAGAGYSVSPNQARRFQSYYLPVTITKVTGNGRVALETGAGITPTLTRWHYDIDTRTGQPGKEESLEYTFHGNIGLRLQPLRYGLLFRLYWSPMFHSTGEFSPYWVGACLGFGFK